MKHLFTKGLVIGVLCFCSVSVVAENEPDNQEQRGRGAPPAEAISACDGVSEGESCSFINPRGDEMAGTCRTTRNDVYSCAPARGSRQGGMGGMGGRGNKEATEQP